MKKLLEEMVEAYVSRKHNAKYLVLAAHGVIIVLDEWKWWDLPVILVIIFVTPWLLSPLRKK